MRGIAADAIDFVYSIAVLKNYTEENEDEKESVYGFGGFYRHRSAALRGREK
jgi:hypothetical protein